MYGEHAATTSGSSGRARGLTASDVMTAVEVAHFLQLPQSTVEHLARIGVIPSQKIGRARRYVRQAVEAENLGWVAQ